MLRSEQTALASRVYDVRSQIEVARLTVENMRSLAELVKDGFCVTLEHLQEELESIEEALTPSPVAVANMAPVYDGGVVVALRRVV